MSPVFKEVQILGVPLDLGANQRGANMGPSALRAAGLHGKIGDLGFKVHDDGDVAVPVRETIPEERAAESYRPIITALCRDLANRTAAALGDARIPITIGGDHALAAGTIAGVARWHQGEKRPLGVLWIDAHADMNTPTSSPSGNIHGMPLAALLGQGFPELTALAEPIEASRVCLLGIRDLDAEEQRICRESGVHAYTMREVDERGLREVMTEALAAIGQNGAGIHVSLDLDGLDPRSAPGVSTPVPGGLSDRETHLALEMVADTGQLCGMDLVELNPLHDRERITSQPGVALILSALGKAIL